MFKAKAASVLSRGKGGKGAGSLRQKKHKEMYGKLEGRMKWPRPSYIDTVSCVTGSDMVLNKDRTCEV